MNLRWEDVGTLLAIIVAAAGWIATWKKTVMDKGRHDEEMRVIRDKVNELERKEEYLRGCQEEANAAVRELATDMDWVKRSLARIETLLQGRPPASE